MLQAIEVLGSLANYHNPNIEELDQTILLLRSTVGSPSQIAPMVYLSERQERTRLSRLEYAICLQANLGLDPACLAAWTALHFRCCLAGAAAATVRA